MSDPDHLDTIRVLSDRLVAAQQPIRVLNAIAWDDSIRAESFASGCRREPVVDADHYRGRPLSFDSVETSRAFRELHDEIEKRLGPRDHDDPGRTRRTRRGHQPALASGSAAAHHGPDPWHPAREGRRLLPHRRPAFPAAGLRGPLRRRVVDGLLESSERHRPVARRSELREPARLRRGEQSGQYYIKSLICSRTPSTCKEKYSRRASSIPSSSADCAAAPPISPVAKGETPS